VWVNLSGKQVQRPQLVDEVAETLQKTGLHPSDLGLEITEGTMMEDTRSAIATFRELAALGVRLAIDDFGTGYSSLAALHRFPVGLLKIDRSFVAGLRDDPSEGAAFLSAMISLGQALGMKTVAEGVETAEQAARLREMGCEMAQGNYFSEPLASEAASDLLVADLR
jgi:EAL domain-containing protein (putative c-di-GMP-specific phosphodiesterase class I)